MSQKFLSQFQDCYDRFVIHFVVVVEVVGLEQWVISGAQGCGHQSHGRPERGLIGSL